MIKVGLIGLGKMGLSHYAVFNTHKDVEVSGVCDAASYILTVIKKNNGVRCYKNYKKMISDCNLDAVVVSTPTKYHAQIVRYALKHNLHVFCEKPFCLNVSEGEELVNLAKNRHLVNLVGYHCRFTGIFQKAKDILNNKIIGDVYHFNMEVYGNVCEKETRKDMENKEVRRRGGVCMIMPRTD